MALWSQDSSGCQYCPVVSAFPLQLGEIRDYLLQYLCSYQPIVYSTNHSILDIFDESE